MLRNRELLASDGNQALEVARRVVPDVILCDISLPGLSGYEVATVLRRDPRSAGIRLIAFTAHTMLGDRERCFKAGFDDFVSKPVFKDDLISALARQAEPRTGSEARRADAAAKV